MRATAYLSLVLSAAAAAAAAAATASTSITLQIAAPRQAQAQASQSGGGGGDGGDGAAGSLQQVLSQMPAWTRATLEAGDGRQFVSAPVTAGGALVFANVTAGSYLGEVHCAAYAFGPLRVDVEAAAAEDVGLTVSASETYRGNDWSNRGEVLPRLAPAAFAVAPLSAARKVYYTERSTFSALGVLRNPMILIGLVTMAIVFGMPYLVENMDPEMKAEWEAQQKQSPLNNIMGGGQGKRQGTPGAGFDMAAYLAGSGSGSSGSGSGRGQNQNQGVRR